MQTPQLIIPGTYYDSQLYSGRLYLWRTDGSILVIDWDKLIDGIEIEDTIKLALSCAFLQSEYLYGDHWKLIFRDAEIRSVLENKFELLGRTPIELSKEHVDLATLRIQENPFPFPHSDTAIYRNEIFTVGRSGVFASRITKRQTTPVNLDARKLWDNSILGLAPSYSTLALAAGTDGLFEYPLDYGFSSYSHEARQLSKNHSNSVRWMYSSVFSSSYHNYGYLMDFTIEDQDDSGKRQRVLRDYVPTERIFSNISKKDSNIYAWGLHDKICIADDKFIGIVQYQPYKDANERFRDLGTVAISLGLGDIVNADSALFGYIIEMDNGLLVLKSNLETLWLEGEPVNWRVFARSKFYENQLHVAYDDHLSVFSFNDDYFVNQDDKKIGTRHRKPIRNNRY